MKADPSRESAAVPLPTAARIRRSFKLRPAAATAAAVADGIAYDARSRLFLSLLSLSLERNFYQQPKHNPTHFFMRAMCAIHVTSILARGNHGLVTLFYVYFTFIILIFLNF